MIALLLRTYEKNLTKGSLLIYNGEEKLFCCKVLELPNNGNQRNVSCIPEGTYQAMRIEDNRRGTVFHVMDVPDRFGILIHKGNFTKDTKGCLIPGMYFTDINNDGLLDIADSTKAMDKLLEILPERFKLIIMS